MIGRTEGCPRRRMDRKRKGGQRARKARAAGKKSAGKSGLHASATARQKARAHLERQGWVVLPSAGALGPWALVALHPQHGVKVVCALDQLPRPSELEALEVFPVHPAWGRDVWVFSARLARRRGNAMEYASKRHGQGP